MIIPIVENRKEFTEKGVMPIQRELEGVVRVFPTPIDPVRRRVLQKADRRMAITTHIASKRVQNVGV